MNAVSTSPTTPSNLQDVYRQWLELDHPSQPGLKNKDRKANDLLNYQRAARCFALGSSGGVDNLELVPASSLDVREMLLGRQVEQGLKLLYAKQGKGEPSEKTIKNLISCSRALQAVVLKGKPASLAGKSTIQTRRSRPKRRARKPFLRKNWPESLKKAWAAYAQWKMKPVLSQAEGARFRKQACRPISMDAQLERVNPYVGYLMREKGITEPTLKDLCSLDNYSDYLNYYLQQDANCGYSNAKMTGTTLGTLSQYLVAKGQLSQHTPDGKDIWKAFYELSHEPMKVGADRGELGDERDIGNWKPDDLFELGMEAWETEPVRRQRGNEGRWKNQQLCRKRSALFFILAYETPFRARNFREMRWHHNLKKLPTGSWQVTFKGNELKVSRRGFKTNTYQHTYSAEASLILDSWHALLQEHFGEGFEKAQPYVFPGFMQQKAKATPIMHAAFANHISDLCEELRGERFNLHKVRHIVASYLVNEHGPKGMGLAIKLLGDTGKVVFDSYYKPNNEEALQDYLKLRFKKE